MAETVVTIDGFHCIIKLTKKETLSLLMSGIRAIITANMKRIFLTASKKKASNSVCET